METLKITLPSALDAGVDFLKLGELRIKITTRTAGELTRMNVNMNKASMLSIVGSSVQFCDSTGNTNLGTSANLSSGSNILYFKPTGVFYFSFSDKFAITQLGDSGSLFSRPTTPGTAATSVYAELELKDLFYTNCVRIRATDTVQGDISKVSKLVTYFDVSKTANSLAKLSGTIGSSVFNFPALTVLNLSNQAINGSLTGINMPLASIIRLANTLVSGEITRSNISTELRELDLFNTDVRMDLSILSDLAQNVILLNLSGSLCYGDISVLSNFKSDLGNLKGLNLSGDVASIGNEIYFLSNMNVSTYRNANANLSTTFWTNKKAGRTYILACESVRIVTGVDQFLIDMAGLELHPTAVSGGVWMRTISIRGTRTSASDSAVTTLAGKGVTVTLLSV